MHKNAIPNSIKRAKSLNQELTVGNQRSVTTGRRKLKYRTELSSGGIIFRRRSGKAQVFFIRDPYGRWTFPKGHQEAGENLVQTARREIEEETGLTGLRLITPLGRTRFKFRRDKYLIDKTVHFFLFQAAPQAKEKLPGTEGILSASWFGPGQARTKSGYRNMDRLLNKALKIVGRQGSRGRTSSVSEPRRNDEPSLR